MSPRCETCGQALPQFGGIVADMERGEIRYGGGVVYLTRQESEIFAFLLEKKGRAVDKGAILDRLYQLEQDEAEIKIIDVFICKIRKKIAPLGLAIGTVWGRGYFLEPPPGQREAA